MEETQPGPQDFGALPPAPQSYPAPALSQDTVKLLDRTRPWVYFMAVLGFVSAGFMVLGGIGVGVAGLATQKPEFAIVAILYPLLGVVYIFPSLYLYRYAARIRALAATPQLRQLEAALDAQRSFWKFVGVMTVIGIAFGILMFMFAIAAGVLAGMKQQRL